MTHPRQEDVPDFDGDCNVHRSWERVVGTLALVDVVVGMNGILRPQLASESLDGSVGNHLTKNNHHLPRSIICKSMK
jgi:hypothetical protein